MATKAGQAHCWDKRQGPPRLSRKNAKQLLAKVLDQYRQHHRQLPTTLVVHKSAAFGEDEIAGFEEALADDIRTTTFSPSHAAAFDFYAAGMSHLSVVQPFKSLQAIRHLYVRIRAVSLPLSWVAYSAPDRNRSRKRLRAGKGGAKGIFCANAHELELGRLRLRRTDHLGVLKKNCSNTFGAPGRRNTRALVLVLHVARATRR